MSIVALASGLWHSATALLAPNDTTATFTLPKQKPPSPTPPGETGAPSTDTKTLRADLQSWIAAQQAQQTTTPNAARAQAAYTATATIARH